MTTPEPTAFCDQCGARIPSASRFCTECGAEQSAPAAPAGAAVSSAAAPGYSTAPPASASGMRWDSGSLDNMPYVAGLPLELWLVIAAFGIPGAWIVFDLLKALPDAIKVMGSNYFGFRLGLALLLILVLVGFIGVAMLVIAWRLYQRDRVGRGLAYAFAGTIILAVVFADNATTAEVCAMLISIVGIAILGLTPRVREIFDRAASPDGEPTSVVVSRTLIAVFTATAALTAVSYLLLATINGKYVLVAIIAAAIAVGSSVGSRRLKAADRQARLYLSVGAGIGIVLLLILGRSDSGLLVTLGWLASAVGALWLPNDARVFFGDQPIKLGASL